MENKQEQSATLTFSEIIRIIRQRLWFILLILFVFIAATFIYNEATVPLYMTNLKLAVSSDSSEVRLPDQSYKYQDYYSRMARMETHLEVMKSTEVVKRLLEEPDIKKIAAEEKRKPAKKRNYFGEIKTKIRTLFKKPSTIAPVQKKEEEDLSRKILLARLKGSIRISVKPDTNLFDVTVVDRNPQMAAAVANNLAVVYREYMLQKKMQGVRGNLSWLSQEIQKLRGDIRTSQGSMEEISSEQNILHFEQDPEFLSRELSRMRGELNETGTKSAELDAEISEMHKILKEGDKYVPGFLDSEVLREIHVKLVMSRLELQSLSKKYKSKHPAMIEKRSEVGFLVQQFNKELEKALSSLESKRKIIQAKEDSLVSMIDQYRLQSSVKGDEGAELSLIQGEIESNKELYQLLLRQIKSANISESLLKETIEVIEPAKVPLVPYRPLKRMNLIIAFLLGSFVGIVLAIVLDFIEAKIISQEDVEKYLDLNVLGTLPLLKEEDGLKIQDL